MEVGDLPLGLRLRELLLEPALLVLVHVVAVEREEADVLLLIGVEALAAHAERLVVHLVRVVVIAERGVEFDLGVEQRLERLLELARVVLRPLGAVHVVAEHDRELVREHAVRLPHLLRGFDLRPVAGAAVADDEELDRVFAHRRQRRGRGRYLRRRLALLQIQRVDRHHDRRSRTNRTENSRTGSFRHDHRLRSVKWSESRRGARPRSGSL